VRQGGVPQWDPGASPGGALTDEVPPKAEAYLLITFDVLGEKNISKTAKTITKN